LAFAITVQPTVKISGQGNGDFPWPLKIFKNKKATKLIVAFLFT
jgi:hypothetical protein